MNETHDATRFLVVLLLVTMLAGVMVIVVKSDYRVRDNMLSNMEYYPHLTVEKGAD